MEHSFDIEIAKEYGIEEAILLKHIDYWVYKNEANGKNFYDGYYWTYNSIKAFKELFPYMSEKKIRNALNKLIENGLIITGCYNSDVRDRTLWYAITEKGKSILPKSNLHFTERANDNNILYTNNNTNINNTDIIPNINKENIKEMEEIFNYWNSCNIIKHAKLTDDMKRLLKTRLNEYDVEQLKECISHYSEAYHSEYEYCQFKWSILTFFKQKNAYLDFMEDGSKWNNYLRWKNENNISYNFDTTNEQQRELQYYTNLKNTDKQKYDEELYQLKYWKPELYEYIYNQLENGGFEEL